MALAITSITSANYGGQLNIEFTLSGMTAGASYRVITDTESYDFEAGASTDTTSEPAGDFPDGSHTAQLSEIDAALGIPIGTPSARWDFSVTDGVVTSSSVTSSSNPGSGNSGGGGAVTPPPSTGEFTHGDRVRVWVAGTEMTIGHDPRLSLTSIDGLGTTPERRVQSVTQSLRQGDLTSLRTDRASATWGATSFSLPLVIIGAVDADGQAQRTEAATIVASRLKRSLEMRTAGIFPLVVQNALGETWAANARRTAPLSSAYNKRQWLIKGSLDLTLDVPMWEAVGPDLTITVSGSRDLTELADLDAPIDNASITLPGHTKITDGQTGFTLENRGGETLTILCSPTYAQNPRAGSGSLENLFWNGLGAFTIGDGTGTPHIEHSGGPVTITCRRRTLCPL